MKGIRKHGNWICVLLILTLWGTSCGSVCQGVREEIIEEVKEEVKEEAKNKIIEVENKFMGTLIDTYLRSKASGSPLIGQGHTFVAAGRKFNVDPRLLVAIAGHESSFAREECQGQDSASIYNAWGWEALPPPCRPFDSWQESIWFITEKIATGDIYFAKGRDTVEKMGAAWVCGPNASSCPDAKNWIDDVTYFIEWMGGDPNNLTFRVFE